MKQFKIGDLVKLDLSQSGLYRKLINETHGFMIVLNCNDRFCYNLYSMKSKCFCYYPANYLKDACNES